MVDLYIQGMKVDRFLDRVAVHVFRSRVGKKVSSAVISQMKAELLALSRQHPDLPSGATHVDVERRDGFRGASWCIMWSWGRGYCRTELIDLGPFAPDITRNRLP